MARAAAESDDLRQRLVLTSNIGGDRVRVRLSNTDVGASMIDGLRVAVEEGAAPEPVLVHGKATIVLAPGEEVYSDPVPLHVRPGDSLEISSWSVGRQSAAALSMVLAGSQAWLEVSGALRTTGPMAEPLRKLLGQPGFGMVSGITSVEVDAREPVAGIALFGDSMTQMGFWPAALEARLRSELPGRTSVRNLGIAGNRVLHDAPASMPSFGAAGIRRFEREVFGSEPVDVVVVFMGVNDLIHPVTVPDVADQVVEPGALMAALETFSAMAHEHGAPAVACTIPPFYGYEGWTPEVETVRAEVNKRLRTAASFDAVVDLEPMLASESVPPGLRGGLDLGDHLHPGPAGGAVIAAAVMPELRKLLTERVLTA
ncbi:GDSL-type esterase/lipase family protein [Kutzneria sp. NPDC052558]|uniref:GDSL-type esterase/lipase family protein n=1 Tax=Kutzneria sp. NPDC052558 TaxID=3364121 RepID=UPI0037C5B2F0